MLSITWIDHVTNVAVLCRISTEKETPITLKRKKLEYLSYVITLARYSPFCLMMEWKLLGKRTVERIRML